MITNPVTDLVTAQLESAKACSLLAWGTYAEKVQPRFLDLPKYTRMCINPYS